MALHWPYEVLRGVLDQLAVAGLTTPSADDVGAVRAIEPALVLPTLASRRLGEPAAGDAAIEHVIALHSGARERLHRFDGDGLDGVTSVAECLAAAVENEVTILAHSPWPASVPFATHVVEGVLHRGAELRTLLSTGLLRDAVVMQRAQWLGHRHARARTVPRVATSAMIIDRVAALVLEADGSPRLIGAGPALGSLIRLADQLWRFGVDVVACGTPPAPAPRSRGQRVLGLLAEGLTDEAIARRIGVSVRTVRSEVATAITTLGARGRFQAGVRAAQLGLV